MWDIHTQTSESISHQNGAWTCPQFYNYRDSLLRLSLLQHKRWRTTWPPQQREITESSQLHVICTWSARHSGRPSARHGLPLTSPRSPQATSPSSGTCNGSLWHSLAWLVHGSDYRCRSQLGHRTFSVPLPPSKKQKTPKNVFNARGPLQSLCMTTTETADTVVTCLCGHAP